MLKLKRLHQNTFQQDKYLSVFIIQKISMTQCIEAIQKHIASIVQLSGKYFYHMGQYNDCLQTPQMKYNLIMFKNSISNDQLGISMGLCLPQQCHIPLIKSSINTILTQMQIPLAVSSINNETQNYQYEFSFAFYLTVIITIVSLLLVIIAILKPKLTQISMFSIKESKKIFKHHPESDLNVLNGIRSISMIWVVLGHCFLYTLGGSINILTTVQKKQLLKPFFLIVQAGFFAVDIFFFIGGFLLAYVFLKQGTDTKTKYPFALVQRILRIWPSYLYSMLIFYSVYLHLGSGPFWGNDQDTVQYCAKIWKPLLFIDNLVQNGQTQCMAWGWYLQNDMQLFVVSLILLFVYSIKPIVSKIFLSLLTIGSVIFTFVWANDHGIYVLTHISDFQRLGDFELNVYMKPWGRAPPYLIGLFLGMLYFQYLEEVKKAKKANSLEELEAKKKSNNILSLLSFKFKESRKFRIIFELIGLTIIIFIVFIPRTLQVQIRWPQYLHSLYQSLSKVFIIIGLSILILPSLLGCKKSMVRFTMDTKLWNYIAKISFCTYLIHLTVLEIWLQSRTNSRYYTIMPVFVQFGGILIISLVFGMVMTFLIEIPCSKLQKKLLGKLKSIAKIDKSDAKNVTINKVNYSKGINESLISKD